jgi:hypothetical protein
VSKRPTKSQASKRKAGKRSRLKSLSPKGTAGKVHGGKRTVVKDSHDRHANIEINL